MTYSQTSASQVEAFRRCPRYWYQKNILKIPDPPKPGQERGKAVHRILEKYFKTGAVEADEKDDQALVIAKQGMHLLPTPAQGMLVEHPFDLETYTKGPKWVGYIDLVVPSMRRIVDHKTTKDFRWAKTSLELLENTQMVSYARWFMREYGTEHVELQHVVFKTTRAYDAQAVSVKITAHGVETGWSRDVELVREMSDLAGTGKATIDDIAPNTEACGMFGGCTYRSRCGTVSDPFVQLSLPSNRGVHTMSEGNGKMSILDQKLNARRAAAGMLPVVSPPPMSEPKELPIGKVFEVPSVVTAMAEEMASVIPPDAPDRNEKVNIAQVDAEGGPRKRGRPKKTVEQPELTPVASSPDVEEPPTVTKPEARSFILCIDGFMLKDCDKRDQTLSADWLQPALDAVNNAQGTMDPRLLEYGQGTALVAAEIRRRLPHVPPVLLVDSMSPFAKELVAALTPHASMIFKGAK